MIEREAAVQAVEEQLERDYQEWRTAGGHAVRMAVTRVKEHELVWIVSWQSEEFVRTGNPKFMLVGSGPYLVDRLDGGCTGSAPYPPSPETGRPTTEPVSVDCRYVPR